MWGYVCKYVFCAKNSLRQKTYVCPRINFQSLRLIVNRKNAHTVYTSNVLQKAFTRFS